MLESEWQRAVVEFHRITHEQDPAHGRVFAETVAGLAPAAARLHEDAAGRCAVVIAVMAETLARRNREEHELAVTLGRFAELLTAALIVDVHIDSELAAAAPAPDTVPDDWCQ